MAAFCTLCILYSMQAVEWTLKGKPTLFGAVSGAISGLVVITPGAGYVDQTGAFVMGMYACSSSYYTHNLD